MRRAGIALAVLLGLALAAGVWARLLAGGPVGPIPGGRLSGEAVSEPVTDWSFAREIHYADVESRARTLPYSRSCWFMVHENRLFLLLPSLFGDGLKQRLDEDPRVRIRLDGKVYAQRAVPYESEAGLGVLLRPFLRRQMGLEISGEVTRVGSGLDPELWVYRLENREDS